MLFQGEEFGSSKPFLYFSDVGDENLREAIRKGRFRFLAQFPSIATKKLKRAADTFDPEMWRDASWIFRSAKRTKALPTACAI